MKKLSRTEKDFKAVYKKIKKNKKYFISIKDIVVLESLEYDGISLPEDLDYTASIYTTNSSRKFRRFM